MRTNSDLCHLQHKLIGFYNPDEKCLQRGTDWVFKQSGLPFVFKRLILFTIFFLIFCWPCISIYLFININQLDALNFIISLFQASTCFEHICSSSGGQKLYYTVSGIITPVGVHMCSSSGGQKLYYTVSGIITPIGVMIPETV